MVPKALGAPGRYQIVRYNQVTSIVCGKNGCEQGLEPSFSSKCRKGNAGHEVPSVFARIWTRTASSPWAHIHSLWLASRSSSRSPNSCYYKRVLLDGRVHDNKGHLLPTTCGPVNHQQRSVSTLRLICSGLEYHRYSSKRSSEDQISSLCWKPLSHMCLSNCN